MESQTPTSAAAEKENAFLREAATGLSSQPLAVALAGMVALGVAMGRVLADWASGTPLAALEFPVTPPRPIPFHALRKPAVRATVALFRLRDRLGL